MPTLMTARALAGALACLGALPAMPWSAAAQTAPPEWVWWEGESFDKSNFPAKTWFSPQNDQERAVLSGGNWLTNIGKRGSEEPFATYRVAVPKAAAYNFWVRKCWQHGPFRWRFDDQPWRLCGRDAALADSATVRTNVPANWVNLGKLDLGAGQHTFEIRLTAKPGEDIGCGFDAFLLIPGPFMPAGRLKPGQRSGLADAGFFAYEPQIDPFGPEAMLDLRSLNEKEAGINGFVKRKGDSLTLADGHEVRFWAVNISTNNISQDRQSIDYMARRLAKLGVNMVRFHSPLFASSAKAAHVDAKRLDDLMYTIAALRKEGVYTTVSFYFPLWLNAKEAGFEGFDSLKNDKPFGLVFFDPAMQELWRAWAKALLTTEDPYNGKTLAQETALAMVEVLNEDSLLFWTFSKQNIPAVHWQRLEKRFGQWLTAKYGSLDKAAVAWGGAKTKGDNPAAGIAELYEAWHFTRDGLSKFDDAKRRRMGDQVRFLAQVQREFYQSAVKFIKDSCGYGGLVYACNWITADATLLDPIERYTYTVGDVIDRHGYFDARHEGDGASWSVRDGHTYEDLAPETVPQRVPLQFSQVAGFPQIMTELDFTHPNRFRGSMTFLAAAYGAIQGADGIYFFALGSNYVRDTSIGKFQVASPAVCATLPGGAIVFRRGYVQTGPPAVVNALKLDDLMALKGEQLSAAAGLEALRAKDAPAAAKGAAKRVAAPNPAELTFFAGPVLRAYDAPSGTAANLRDLLADGRVRSTSGQMNWEYSRGLVTMRTPKALGACGMLKAAGRIDFGQATIECSNEYGAVLVVSLDDRPLDQAGEILVQAMTEERPYGWKAQGGKILSIGDFPFGVRKIECKLTLSGLHGQAIALDENGYPLPGRLPVDGTVTLPPEAIYTIIERGGAK